MDMFWSDVRFALRSFRKSPGFTAVAVATIALGVGANTAIFTFLDGVLLRPVPYPDPEQLVQLWEKPPGFTRNSISAANFIDWRRQSASFQGMAASTGQTVTWTGTGEPRRLRVRKVSAPYFDVLGVRASLGRTFAPGEDRPGGDRVVVLTHRLWQSSFGADPGILGRSLVLDDESYTVIGILPSGSEFDRGWSDIWIPLAFGPGVARNFHYLVAIARLKPGVSLEQARTEMSAIAARIAEQYPDIKKDWGVTIDRWTDRMVSPQLKLSLVVLMAAVGMVLLIGCANLANLLLARGTMRSHEMTIRVALGAGRRRLIQQLLTESMLLSLSGAAAGLALGYGLFRGIHALLPPFFLPSQVEVALDLRVILFSTALAVVTGLLFGLAPALLISRRDPAEALKEGGRGSAGGPRRLWLRNSLVVSEVALAFVLLAGAGLLVRSFHRLIRVDAGFDSTNVLTAYFQLMMDRDTDGARLTGYLNQALEAVRAVPGVRDAALTSALPLQGWGFGMPFRIAGRASEPSRRPPCFFKIVTPGYFSTLGMQVRKGRGLAEGDAKGAVPVTLINESFARQYFPNEDPIGKRVLIEQIITGKRELGPEVPWQVVGIVGDEKVNGLDSTRAGVYVTYAQSPISA